MQSKLRLRWQKANNNSVCFFYTSRVFIQIRFLYRSKICHSIVPKIAGKGLIATRNRLRFYRIFLHPSLCEIPRPRAILFARGFAQRSRAIVCRDRREVAFRAFSPTAVSPGSPVVYFAARCASGWTNRACRFAVVSRLL